MATGVAFDPAEFAAFKAQGAAPEQLPGNSGGFDPAEFEAFKATQPAPRRKAGSRPDRVPSQVPNPFDRGGEPDAASFSDRFGSGPMARADAGPTVPGRTVKDLVTGGEAAPSVATDQAASDALYGGLRSKADEMLVGKPGPVNQAAAALIRGSNAAGINIPRGGGGAVATGLGKVGLGPDRSYTQNLELAADQEDALSRQYPKTALAGTVAGVGAGAVVAPGAITATAWPMRMAQGAALGGAYGGASELLGTADPMKALKAGVIGGAVGLVATPAIDLAIPVVEKGGKALWSMISSGVPVTNAAGELTTTARAMLARQGVPNETLTPEVRSGIARVVARKGESEAAIREGLAEEFGIPLSRGQATGEAKALDLEQASLTGDRGTKAQGVAQDFAQRQSDAIEAAGGRIADRAGRGVTLDNPQQASEVVADQARELAKRSTAGADETQAYADHVLAQIRGGAPLDTLDAGATVASGLRDAAERSKGAYREAYGEVGRIPGTFDPGALDRMGARVRDRLGPEVPIDDRLTPAAASALQDLDNLPGLFGLKPGEGPNLQQVEQLRKRLVSRYGSTSQNPTDRRALGQIIDGLDQHVEDAMSVGLFGSSSRASGRAAGAVDDFPGASALDTASAGSLTLPDAPTGSPETFARWLGRNGGVEMTGDTRAMDLHRTYVPGGGALARRDGTPLDQIRVKATEAGFLPPGADGETAQEASNRILEMLQSERIGRPHYRIEDEARIGGGREASRISESNAEHAAEVDRQARRMQIDFEGMGLGPRDIDRATLNDAAERMVLGHADNAAMAYEQAVARRGETARPEGTRSRTGGDDVPFPGLGEGTSVAASDVLPIGDTAPADAMRNARSLFRAYKTDFAPQGAGDDVGLAMRKIVDRAAEPIEVSRMLYAGSPGLNIRIADRVKRVVGEDSPTWAAHREGYLSSIINGRDMTPKAVVSRIDAALSGERRGLTYRVLSDQQVAGLRQFQTASRAAQSARAEVPEWVAGLGRTDFDPNKVSADLFGSGIPGSRPGSAAFAGSLKKFLGEDSAEWSGLRLAAVQRLILKPDGSGMLPAKQVAQRLREFTDGKGSGLSKQLFEPELLAEMRRYGSAVQSTIRGDGSALPNGGGMAGKMAGKALDAIVTGIGFKLGGPAGAGAAWSGRLGSKAIQGQANAWRARRSFEEGAPLLRIAAERRALPALSYTAGQAGEGSQ